MNFNSRQAKAVKQVSQPIRAYKPFIQCQLWAATVQGMEDTV